MADPYHIGFLLWPGLTQLDMTGPAQVLSRMPGAQLHFVWKQIAPIPSDCGLSLMPTTTLDDCPQLDMVCVPGGAPVAPVAPAAPAGPVAPVLPCGPCAPGAPAGPCTPCEPVSPVAPCGPWGPCGP